MSRSGVQFAFDFFQPRLKSTNRDCLLIPAFYFLCKLIYCTGISYDVGHFMLENCKSECTTNALFLPFRDLAVVLVIYLIFHCDCNTYGFLWK